MLDACTRCGACVSACPIVAPAGLDDVEPKSVIEGVLDIVRSGQGTEAAKKWAQSCMLSGDCITACQEDVNPRFLLATARVDTAWMRTTRWRGVSKASRPSASSPKMWACYPSSSSPTRSSSAWARGTLQRWHQATCPTSCFTPDANVLKTPHIALLCLDIMDALAIKYRVLGGPSIAVACSSGAPGTPRSHRAWPVTPSAVFRSPGNWPGARLVPQLLRAVHREHPPHHRANHRQSSLRHDAVHALPTR